VFFSDVQVPDPNQTDGPKRSVRLKAFPGNNLTNLALNFFDDHVKTYNSSDLEFVVRIFPSLQHSSRPLTLVSSFSCQVNHLESAAGGKCDACKTFVEVLTDRFVDMGVLFAKVDGYDKYGKPLKSMHVNKVLKLPNSTPFNPILTPF